MLTIEINCGGVPMSLVFRLQFSSAHIILVLVLFVHMFTVSSDKKLRSVFSGFDGVVRRCKIHIIIKLPLCCFLLIYVLQYDRMHSSDRHCSWSGLCVNVHVHFRRLEKLRVELDQDVGFSAWPARVRRCR